MYGHWSALVTEFINLLDIHSIRGRYFAESSILLRALLGSSRVEIPILSSKSSGKTVNKEKVCCVGKNFLMFTP